MINKKTSRKWIGAHVSAAGGVENVPINAKEIGAQAFALFTKNQRQWSAKPLTKENVEGFKSHCEKYGYSMDRVLPHASYLINIGNPGPVAWKKSRNALLDEMQRCEQLGITMINVHPGAHLRQISESECLTRIADAVNELHQETQNVTIVLENTAGQGSNVGYRFEQLSEIIDQVEDRSRVGVCIDTCHAYAAGYDIKTESGFKQTVAELRQLFGRPFLKGLHLNDSKRELGSRVDRHEKLGEGELGWHPFRMIVNEPFFDEMPLILETPDMKNWATEIRKLYKLID
ncbi:MAG TPA: deoxyribonuclease IV [Balneolales bacterium]|nr:deoxyribonuclease IV [Balneolales bacterium]